MESREGRSDKYFLDWNVVRSDDGSRIHVLVHTSGQQQLLANGDLQTRWRSVDCRQKRPYRLEVDG